MNRRTLRNMVIGSVVLATFTMFTSAASAGWGHWRGLYSTYGGWGCGVAVDPCCTPCFTPCRPAYTPCFTACRPAYNPCNTCFDPCPDPCRVSCVGPLRRLWYRLATHHYAYYGCGTGCWTGCGLYSGYTACCPTCGCDPCDCGSGWDATDEGTIIEGPIMAPAKPNVAPTPAVAPPPAAPTAPAKKAPAPAPPAANVPPALPPAAAPAPGKPGLAPPASERQTSIGPNDAMLTVRVPESALVFVNGAPTRSTGVVRHYVSRDLTPGFQYTYELRVVTQRNGRPATATRTVRLRAGHASQLAFTDTARDVETMLTLHVPRDAKVYLAGQPMRGSGSVRTFRTHRLAAGDVWKDYAIQVTVQQNGQLLAKEKTIALAGGQQREMTFEFSLDRLASAR